MANRTYPFPPELHLLAHTYNAITPLPRGQGEHLDLTYPRGGDSCSVYPDGLNPQRPDGAPGIGGFLDAAGKVGPLISSKELCTYVGPDLRDHDGQCWHCQKDLSAGGSVEGRYAKTLADAHICNECVVFYFRSGDDNNIHYVMCRHCTGAKKTVHDEEGFIVDLGPCVFRAGWTKVAATGTVSAPILSPSAATPSSPASAPTPVSPPSPRTPVITCTNSEMGPINPPPPLWKHMHTRAYKYSVRARDP
jgi:hypothetical protein